MNGHVRSPLFAGAPARRVRGVRMEAEASPAPVGANGHRAILRLTIDTGVEFFRVEPRLALSSAPLRRELLGEPAGREERTIVEVKYLDGPVKHLDGPVPAWARSSGGARRYSKFAEAMRQVHGVGETRAAVG